MKKIVSGIFAAAAAVALISCGDAMHPTGPDGSGGPTIRPDAISSEGAGGPTIATDKSDYSPGDTVSITGFGWQPNESVDLRLTETPDTNPPTEWTIIADSIGSFTDRSFAVNESHLGVAFQLIATGAASADTAQGVFSDGNVSIKTNFGTMHINWNSYSNTGCSGLAADGGNNISVNTSSTTLVNIGSSESADMHLTSSPSGMTFQNWSGPSTVTTTTVCFVGASSPRNWLANFAYNTTTAVTADLTSPQTAGTSINFSAHVTRDADGSNVGNAPKNQGGVAIYDGGTCGSPGPELQALTNLSGTGIVSVSTASLSAGAHTILACYSGSTTGDPDHLESFGTLPFTIDAASVGTTTAVDASPASPSEYGTSVTFTATVTVTAGGAAVTTGDVSFHDGTCAGTELQAATGVDASGQATYTPATSLSVGSHTVAACYEGATGFDASDGSTVYDVNKIGTTTTVTSDLTSPQVWNTEIVFTAEVNRTSDDGDVTEGDVAFYDGATCALPSVLLQAGTAVDGDGKVTLTTSSLSVGTHEIRACYLGNDTLETSTGSESFTINKIPTSVDLTLTPATQQQYSDKVTLSASITPTGVAGSVQFQKKVGVGAFTDLGSPVAVVDDATEYVYTIVESSADALEFKAVFTPTDTDHYDGDDDSDTYTVTKEDAAVAFSSSNDAAVQAPAGLPYTGTVSFAVTVREKTPDIATATAAAGDIDNAVLASVTMSPIGGGSGFTLACGSPSNNGMTGYARILTFTCSTSDVFPVGTYQLDASVTGNYYVGGDTDAFTVFDPTLGFATGGGTFNLGGDRVNFGFTMKYNKSGSNLQGNLIAVRHHADGTVSRLKSNQLAGLAIQNASSCGTAQFSGKATFTTWDGTDYVTTGNNSFSVSAKDCNNPGTGYDYFWMDAPGDLDMPNFADANSALLTGGNISVPHTIGKK